MMRKITFTLLLALLTTFMVQAEYDPTSTITVTFLSADGIYRGTGGEFQVSVPAGTAYVRFDMDAIPEIVVYKQEDGALEITRYEGVEFEEDSPRCMAVDDNTMPVAGLHSVTEIIVEEQIFGLVDDLGIAAFAESVLEDEREQLELVECPDEVGTELPLLDVSYGFYGEPVGYMTGAYLEIPPLANTVTVTAAPGERYIVFIDGVISYDSWNVQDTGNRPSTCILIPQGQDVVVSLHVSAVILPSYTQDLSGASAAAAIPNNDC